MELFIWITAVLLVTYGAYIIGYNLGKTKLREDYKRHYKEVQNQRNHYKGLAEHYRIKNLKNKEVFKTPPPQESDKICEEYKKQLQTNLKKKAVCECLDKIPFLIGLNTSSVDGLFCYRCKLPVANFKCKHDWMGTLNTDVKICIKCSSKMRRKAWDHRDSFGETWVEGELK